MKKWPLICVGLVVGCSVVTFLLWRDRSKGGENNRFPTESVEYYEAKLRDKGFRWHGPTSREDRIPVLHAARALAYIGDPAVPALLRSLQDETIDVMPLQRLVFLCTNSVTKGTDAGD